MRGLVGCGVGLILHDGCFTFDHHFAFCFRVLSVLFTLCLGRQTSCVWLDPRLLNARLEFDLGEDLFSFPSRWSYCFSLGMQPAAGPPLDCTRGGTEWDIFSSTVPTGLAPCAFEVSIK